MRFIYRSGLFLIVLLLSFIVVAQPPTLSPLQPTPPPLPVFASPTLLPPPLRPMPTATYPFRPSPVPFATPTALPGRPVPEQPIAFGDTVEAVLDTSVPSNHYVFNGEQGQIVLVTLSYMHQFIHLNTFIMLGGNTIYPNNQTNNTQVFHLPANGTYALVINSSHSSDLSVEVPYTLTLDTPPTQSIDYGETVEVNMSPERPVAIYTFSGEAGQRITAEATAPNPGSYFTLSRLESGGFRNTLSGSQYERGKMRIGAFALPAAGDYTLEVYAQYIAEPFDIALKLTEVIPVALSYGETVRGTFNGEDETFYYSFDAAYGDMVDIRVEGDESLDTVLTLYNQYGVMFIDDDAGAYYHPEILRQFINEDGEHIISLAPFTPDAEGDFSLTVERATGYLLDDGEQIVSFGKQGSHVLAFTAQAGETVRLNLKVIDGLLPFINVSQRTRNLLNLGTGDLQDVAIELTIPEAGIVIVRLDRNYGNMDMNSPITASLERLDE